MLIHQTCTEFFFADYDFRPWTKPIPEIKVNPGTEGNFNSEYEDKFFCISNDGTITESGERILVLSTEDYYFFHHAQLEDMNGKYLPKTMEKTFSNVITVNGKLNS